MRVAEQAQGIDLVQVLIGEEGKFIATSPDGGTFVVECRHGHSLTSLQSLPRGSSEEYGVNPVAGNWNVKKIAQLSTLPGGYGSQSIQQRQRYGDSQDTGSTGQQQDRQQQDRR